MKIVLVTPPLQQSSVNFLKDWVGNEKFATNSETLKKLVPDRVTLVPEPTYEQLQSALSKHEVLFIYPNMNRLTRDASNLQNLDGVKELIVDGRYVSLDNIKPKVITQPLTTPTGITLRQYQQQLADFIFDNKRVGLFVDMGLGKTLATLAAMNELFKEDKLDVHKPILVVAPKMVALDTWAREADKWGYDIDVLINVGLTKKKRELLYESIKHVHKPTILTTNPEQLGPLLTHFGGQYQPFQAVIVDELSMFKSYETKRFENLVALSQHAEYFVGLTGTPAPNSLLDIWSQLMAVNPAVQYQLGNNYFKYRSRFFEPEFVDPKTGIVFSWKPQKGAEGEIYQRIEPYVISMKGDSLIDIPDVTYVNKYVRMNPKSKKVYDELDKDIRNELNSLPNGEKLVVDTGDNDITVANKAVLTSKLLQLATGALYDAETKTGEKSYTVFHDEKFNRLKEILETTTSPVLVFYNFISDLDRAQKLLPKFEILNTKDPNVNETIKRWNDGQIPILFANPRSTGHGLNLQDGGHTIIWLSLTWNNEVYRQANKRLHRSGQTHPVQIIHILTEGTVDTEVIERINKKEENQQELLTVLEANYE